MANPAAAYMFQDRKVHAVKLECTFIAIKLDEMQRGLVAEIVSRFKCNGIYLKKQIDRKGCSYEPSEEGGCRAVTERGTNACPEAAHACRI